ncbi:MAG TPA: hypothetical protein VK611_31020 [Acidimicrobiales bacterium]|nr:hypothetical protein [Acidimicrobiales bacterium]
MSDDGNGDGDLGDGHAIGVMMMQQLTDLVDSWGTVLEAVAEHGVDPMPLLKSLAQTLRDTADQLDPVS